MKSIIKNLFAATLIAATTWGLGACSEDDFNLMGQRTRTIHFVGDAQMSNTRSTLTPDNNGNLSFAWQVGDQVVVSIKNTGARIGVLTADAVENEGLTATFKGDLQIPDNLTGTQKFTVAYLGNDATIPTDDGTHKVAFSIDNQLGTPTDMGHHDIMFCKELSVNVDNSIVGAAFTMDHLMAFEDYNFDLPQGVTLTNNAVLTLHGTHVYKSGKLNMMTGEMEDLEEGAITINHSGADFRLNDLSVAVIPAADVLMSATAVIGEDEYEYTPAQAKTIQADHYYRPASNADPKHLVDKWVKAASQADLLSYLNANVNSNKNPHIILTAGIDYELPESLVGFESVTIKGTGDKNADGTYVSKLSSKNTMRFEHTADFTTQFEQEDVDGNRTGVKNPLAKDENGNQLYKDNVTGEKTTASTTNGTANKPLYEYWSWVAYGTDVSNVSLEFSNMELEMKAYANGTANNIVIPLDFAQVDVDEALSNNYTLKIHDCNVSGELFEPAHGSVEIEDCNWTYEENHRIDMSYTMLGITQNFTVKNTVFNVPHTPMFLFYTLTEMWDEENNTTGTPPYNGVLTFENCEFNYTGAGNETYPELVQIDSEYLRIIDSYTLNFKNCTNNGFSKLWDFNRGNEEHRSLVTVNEEGTITK